MVEFHQQNNNFTNKNKKNRSKFTLSVSPWLFSWFKFSTTDLMGEKKYQDGPSEQFVAVTVFSLIKFICRLQGLCVLGTIIKVLFGVPDLPKHIHCMTVWF